MQLVSNRDKRDWLPTAVFILTSEWDALMKSIVCKIIFASLQLSVFACNLYLEKNL